MRRNKPNLYYSRNLLVPSNLPGDTIENKVKRWLTTGEKIDADTPMLYFKRSEGVRPETDIRTDRFDVALDATTKIGMAKKSMISNDSPKDSA